MATAAAVAAAVALSPVASSANPTAPTADANPTACANRVNNTPQEARRLRQQGRPLGPHGQVPADRGRQSGHRRPPVPQFGGARLQGLGRLRGQRHESSGLRRDVAGVQVPLHQLRRGPGDAGGVADAAFVWARHGLQPWSSRRFDERETATRGRHCRARDAHTRSASGCSASDFAGFMPGNIALIQRGTCTFAQKVANAEAAGASVAVIFNEGNPGRTSHVQRGPLRE